MSDMRMAAQKEEPQAQSSAALKVLIADEHYIAREGLKLCLQTIQRNITVLEADTLEAAVSLCRSGPEFDLVLLDLGMSEASGAVLGAFLSACPQQRVVVLSANHRPSAAGKIGENGVLGYLPKNMSKDAFIHALGALLAGGPYASAKVPVASTRTRHPEAADAWRNAKFTARQMDVLAHLIEGKPNKQICKELNLALGTVKTHVGAILGALEVSSRAEAIVTAERSGLRDWLGRRPEGVNRRR
jgi:DNA-binding NarL/FixJ family response regulator